VRRNRPHLVVLRVEDGWVKLQPVIKSSQLISLIVEQHCIGNLDTGGPTPYPSVWQAGEEDWPADALKRAMIALADHDRRCDRERFAAGLDLDVSHGSFRGDFVHAV